VAATSRAAGDLADAAAAAAAEAEDDMENGRQLENETTRGTAATEMMNHFVRCNIKTLHI